MKTALKASLEAAIRAWVEKEAYDIYWPTGLVHNELEQHMTSAAEAVFDATFASSEFTRKEME